MDSGPIVENPDTGTLIYCRPAFTTEGPVNTWEAYYFFSHEFGAKGIAITDWTVRATADTWVDGGLIAEAQTTETCSGGTVEIAGAGPTSLAECNGSTTYRLWAVVARR